MAPKVTDLAARVRAARAYAGLTQKQLADVVGYDEQTVKRTEAGKRTPRDSELVAIAIACDLPGVFFYADFERLHEIVPTGDQEEAPPSTDDPYVRREQLDAVTESLDAARLSMDTAVAAIREEMKDVLSQIADRDATREAVSATRSVTREAQGRAVADHSATEAAGDTHDSADANQEDDPVRREAKP